jgi:hypothetical protein
MPKSAIRSIRVQASQSSDLCFNMPGVIASQNFNHTAGTGPANLGQDLTRYDPTTLYGKLGDDHATDVGLLQFGAAEIRTAIGANALFTLRNEALASSLEQLRQQRKAAFRDRFMHRADIQNLTATFVADMHAHLQAMVAAGQTRRDELDAAYAAAGVGVVRDTKTKTTAPASVSKTTVNPVTTISSQFNEANDVEDETAISTIVEDLVQAKDVQRQKTPRTLGVPSTLQGGKWTPAKAPFETQVVETKVAGPQEMISELQAFSHPRQENEFGFRQAMTTLLPELLKQDTTALKVGHIEQIMASELAAMDMEVRSVQLNFIHTFLTAPIDGIVTGVFKDIGESVEPGEPVLRVENNREILFVGRVQYQGQLWVGRDIELTLASVFEDGTSRVVGGKIVAIRGHESDNDEWELIVRSTNPMHAGRRLLPLNYNLDPDTDAFNAL